MRRRRLPSGMRTDENGLTKKIFKNISETETTTKWVEEVKREAMQSGFTADVIHNRKEFIIRVYDIKTFDEKPPKRRPEYLRSIQRSEARELSVGPEREEEMDQKTLRSMRSTGGQIDKKLFIKYSLYELVSIAK